MSDTLPPPNTAKANASPTNLSPKRILVVTAQRQRDVARGRSSEKAKTKRAKLELVWSQNGSGSRSGRRDRRQDRILPPLSQVIGPRQDVALACARRRRPHLEGVAQLKLIAA